MFLFNIIQRKSSFSTIILPLDIKRWVSVVASLGIRLVPFKSQFITSADNGWIHFALNRKAVIECLFSKSEINL